MARSYVTTSEIARIYKIADSTVRHYRSSGRIVPRSQTPGGHARYDLDEVAVVLGAPGGAGSTTLTTMAGERFAPLGQHDVRSSGRGGILPAEIVALGRREVGAPSASRRRWGGKLLNASRPVRA